MSTHINTLYKGFLFACVFACILNYEKPIVGVVFDGYFLLAAATLSVSTSVSILGNPRFRNDLLHVEREVELMTLYTPS